MSYIDTWNLKLSKCEPAKKGDKVCYKNTNGNWYTGVVTDELEKVTLPIVPPPNNTRMAVTVDYGDISLFQDESELCYYEGLEGKVSEELNEHAQKLWSSSAIYWDKDGKRIGWFPIPEGSDYEQRDQVAIDNGCEDWHIHAIFHSHDDEVGYRAFRKGERGVRSLFVDPITGKEI